MSILHFSFATLVSFLTFLSEDCINYKVFHNIWKEKKIRQKSKAINDILKEITFIENKKGNILGYVTI